jgi:hypothetical protein
VWVHLVEQLSDHVVGQLLKHPLQDSTPKAVSGQWYDMANKGVGKGLRRVQCDQALRKVSRGLSQPFNSLE